ncbi:hypothetical protein BV22DRAFT_1042572 [Leucogyrophana mollusca]|uniref:Uncharacterized protein n=1 Tax=Leucogyrophana mollusca TaxID=85980 RepID=A0ACB8BZP2_9AGAM|nr:hypothetical protein BV22DRAFT_1042572 [Leucogyrophana mollusca]
MDTRTLKDRSRGYGGGPLDLEVNVAAVAVLAFANMKADQSDASVTYRPIPDCSVFGQSTPTQSPCFNEAQRFIARTCLAPEIEYVLGSAISQISLAVEETPCDRPEGIWFLAFDCKFPYLEYRLHEVQDVRKQLIKEVSATNALVVALGGFRPSKVLITVRVDPEILPVRSPRRLESREGGRPDRRSAEYHQVPLLSASS